METFPIGQAMNKKLTLKMGNCNHRKYIPKLLDLVTAGVVDPVKVLTQMETDAGRFSGLPSLRRTATRLDQS